MLTSLYIHQCRGMRIGTHYPENANSISLIVERHNQTQGPALELSFYNLPPVVTDRMLAAFGPADQAELDNVTVVEGAGKVSQLVRAAQAVVAQISPTIPAMTDLAAALRRFPEFEPRRDLPDAGENLVQGDINPPSIEGVSNPNDPDPIF